MEGLLGREHNYRPEPLPDVVPLGEEETGTQGARDPRPTRTDGSPPREKPTLLGRGATGERKSVPASETLDLKGTTNVDRVHWGLGDHRCPPLSPRERPRNKRCRLRWCLDCPLKGYGWEREREEDGRR